MAPASPGQLATAMLLEAVASELVGSLARAGIRTLVIKGPATARWLYDRRGERPFQDLDLLVDPGRFEEARAILRSSGFIDEMRGVRESEVARHARDFRRGRALVDLHRYVPGVASPLAAFELLWRERRTLQLANGAVPAPGEVGSCLVLALSVASAVGGGARPSEDLDRALGRVPRDVWARAAVLAAEVGGGFAQGLRTLPAGERVAAELGLEPTPATPALTPDLFEARLAELRRASTLRGKAVLVVGELVPSRAFMRYSSPLARRGRLGLVAAYATRPLVLAVRTARFVRRRRRR